MPFAGKFRLWKTSNLAMPHLFYLAKAVFRTLLPGHNRESTPFATLVWNVSGVEKSNKAPFDIPAPLNLSQFVEDQNGPSTSQILPSWPSWQWWGLAPPVRSTPPVQRRSADESSARIERSPRIRGGCIC